MIKTDLRQQDIADILGVTQPTISNWLHLRRKPQGLQKKALEEYYPDLAEEIELAWKTLQMSESQ